jgi:hypothetical protein
MRGVPSSAAYAYRAGIVDPRSPVAMSRKGFEFVDVLMAVAAWGDRWTAGDAGPPVLRRHRRCGQFTQIELQCAAWGEILRSADVDVEPGPGRRRGVVAKGGTLVDRNRMAVAEGGVRSCSGGAIVREPTASPR